MAVATGPHLRAVHPTRTHRHQGVFLALFVLGSAAVGLAGALLTPRHQAWYEQLQRPAFDPPSWVFAPVWTLLYALIGIAAWLVWRHHRTWQRDVALRWWTLQLVMSALWAPLFFGARQPVWALADVSLLVVVAAITAVRFLPFDRRASTLFLPYLAWLVFAVSLNAAIVALN